MTSYQPEVTTGKRRIDWLLVSFIAAYAIAWGVWHLPVLIGRNVLFVVAYSLLSFGLSGCFTLMFNGSGSSLIPVLLFHATQNLEDGYKVIFLADGL